MLTMMCTHKSLNEVLFRMNIHKNLNEVNNKHSPPNRHIITILIVLFCCLNDTIILTKLKVSLHIAALHSPKSKLIFYL